MWLFFCDTYLLLKIFLTCIATSVLLMRIVIKHITLRIWKVLPTWTVLFPSYLQTNWGVVTNCDVITPECVARPRFKFLMSGLHLSKLATSASILLIPLRHGSSSTICMQQYLRQRSARGSFRSHYVVWRFESRRRPIPIPFRDQIRTALWFHHCCCTGWNRINIFLIWVYRIIIYSLPIVLCYSCLS